MLPDAPPDTPPKPDAPGGGVPERRATAASEHGVPSRASRGSRDPRARALTPGRNSRPPGFSFNPAAVPLTIAAVLALTAASVIVMLGWHQAADRERLTHLEEKLRSSLARRVMDHRHGLQSVRGLVLASESAAGRAAGSGEAVGRAAAFPKPATLDPVGQAFRAAVGSMNLEAAFPAARRVGKLGRPAPAAPVFPVLYAAGLGGTSVQGMTSLPRTPGIEQALSRATGLGHGVFADTQEGVYLVMPVYRGGLTPVVGERAQRSRGWVFMELDRASLFNGLREELDGELDFRVYASTGAPLADSRHTDPRTRPTEAAPLPRSAPLHVAGRQWRIDTGPSAGFEARPTGDVWLAGTVGVVLACLLAVLQHGQGRLAQRADEMARRMTEDLRAAALTDRLTGLANRPALLHRVQESLERSREDPGYHHAVLFLDFDRFKIINDSLGHQSGDRLLRAIAARIRGQLRAEDVAAASNGRPGPRSTEAVGAPVGAGAAARFGGDEFIVALENLARPQDAVAVAERLLAKLAEPYDLNGREVVSTASIGVVLGDAGYRWAEEMVRDADTAMYEAKDAGRAAYVVFDRVMRERVAQRLQTETDLRGAADRGELELFYQPIMRLGDAGTPPRIHRWEALVRWNHPTRGRLFPDAFIGVAEETGLITSIGSWVLCEALRQLAAWREAGEPGADRWKVGVNLARQQLRGDGLATEVRACLAEHGIRPEALHLEVTETEVMSDPGAAAATLAAVRALGVSVDMDDFGTGHSSLSCLDKFPLDVLKIDRSFVADLEDDPRRVSMLSAVSRLAEDLDIDVVAEGIETADQLAQVGRLRCSHGQGYFFSRPLPPDEAAAWAAEHANPAPLALLGPAEPSEKAEATRREAA